MISVQKNKETRKPKCKFTGFASMTASMDFLLPVFYLLSAVFLFRDVQATDRSAHAYVRTYKDIALSKSTEYSIPYKVILGVAIVESGSGQSRTARELNNHFGIVGKNSLKRKTRYRQYENVRESYDHFCRVLTRKAFYSGLKSTRNHELWIRAISRTGYSEMPSIWEKRVLGVIEDINTL